MTAQKFLLFTKLMYYCAGIRLVSHPDLSKLISFYRSGQYKLNSKYFFNEPRLVVLDQVVNSQVFLCMTFCN
jgi:hypothetical protein